VSQERIVLLDPLGNLGHFREALARPGLPVDVLSRWEDVLTLGRDEECGSSSLVVILDGDGESGLDPGLSVRIGEAAPELPPIVLSVVRDRARGRVWTLAGAGSFLERPVDLEELRSEVDRWLRFSDRLKKSGKRVEELRSFFAMFAHDLKNPLNAISGYCELVMAHPQLPREVAEDLEKVRRNLDLLSTMAQGLLEMVRGNARLRISPRETELSFVVREAVEMMRVRALARGIVIQVRVEGAGALVRIDPPRIIEALANVLDNAIKFSPERSLIQVGVSGEAAEMVITIDDEGSGIPAGEREQIFERFGRPKSHGALGGLGLGLSIARDIVTLHQGSIWAEARSPRGTRIAIRLPKAGAGVVGAPERVAVGAAAALEEGPR
jgi:signal transduction histidine kinase